jgi:hypothetical protein
VLLKSRNSEKVEIRNSRLWSSAHPIQCQVCRFRF